MEALCAIPCVFLHCGADAYSTNDMNYPAIRGLTVLHGKGNGNVNVLPYPKVMPPISERQSDNARVRWRAFVSLFGVIALTVTLAGRTFDVRVCSRPSVSLQSEKAKIQHRDKNGAQWSPPRPSLEPFYIAVCSEAVQPEQEPPLPGQIDDCLYNRPPPRL